MHIKLKKPNEILRIPVGDLVAKRNLFDLIQYSKVEGSEYWEGSDKRIWNTPQQGINWLGEPPHCEAVLIKTRPGSYQHDGWQDDGGAAYRYSFKAVKEKISYTEKANAVLINQPRYGYPVLLFTESGNSWIYQGSFEVSQIQDHYVILNRGHRLALLPEEQADEAASYSEGDRKYVTHLMAERNKSVVAKLKETSDCPCSICGVRLVERYGVECIEAHHKKPMATYSSSHAVSLADFALLCPSCHRVVHKYMKQSGIEYLQIEQIMRGRFSRQVAAAEQQPARRSADGRA
jgi:putative restriction endonuclease